MRISKTIFVGGVAIGGGNPITIQSMTNTNAADVSATVDQITRLAAAGCEIVRVAVPDLAAADALRLIKKRSPLPVAADVHFDYRLALAALDAGADKLRINPGNIGGAERVRKVAAAAAERGTPIRVGANSGSLARDIIEKYGGVTAEGLCESALRHAEMLEDCGFSDIVLSLKSPDAVMCVEACLLAAERTNYPLHIGVTEAGFGLAGAVKSAVGIGSVLSRGIGDTIRVSLTADPLEEIACAKEILRAVGARKFGPEIISCPTCGRTGVDLIKIAAEVERGLKYITKPIKVAVMGCEVNGPGEARTADIGLAAGKGSGVIFKKGKIVRSAPEDQLVAALLDEIHKDFPD